MNGNPFSFDNALYLRRKSQTLGSNPKTIYAYKIREYTAPWKCGNKFIFLLDWMSEVALDGKFGFSSG